jgi:hypothetical protein
VGPHGLLCRQLLEAELMKSRMMFPRMQRRRHELPNYQQGNRLLLAETGCQGSPRFRRGMTGFASQASFALLRKVDRRRAGLGHAPVNIRLVRQTKRTDTLSYGTSSLP